MKECQINTLKQFKFVNTIQKTSGSVWLTIHKVEVCVYAILENLQVVDHPFTNRLTLHNLQQNYICLT